MAKFMTTRAAGSALEELIKTAGATLTLVSPYLKLSKDFRDLLTYRNSKDKVTTVIYGKLDLKPDEMAFLQGLRFVILKFKENLHAKCYVNDQHMIITSMNLYEFSMAHNREMGVFIDKNDPADTQLFEEAMKEVDFISETSQRLELSAAMNSAVKAAAPNNAPKSEPAAKTPSADKGKGYCIRTGVEIPFNLEKPLSYEAFKSWSKFSNKEYPEKFCHLSGEASNGETSVGKPILKKNWSKAKVAHGL